jgi:outer membrane translocation and assembly module TamA
LKKYKIESENKDIEKKEIRKYIRQKPNDRILGLKIPLALYNLSNPDKNKGFSKFLKNIGEEPVIWDQYMTEESRKQIIGYLEKKGYYNAEVSDTVLLDDQKATVKYNLHPNAPYFIDNVEYAVRDSILKPFILPDTNRLPLEEGKVFSLELLQQERNMIESILRNKGFYRFSKDFVNFIADTLGRRNLVDLKVEINKFMIKQGEDEFKTTTHKRYKIDSIFIFPDYDPKEAIAHRQEYLQNVDTTVYDDLIFVYNDDPGVDLDIISQMNYIREEEWYSQEEVDQTYERLNSLRLFKIINIKFDTTRMNTQDSRVMGLNGYIYLQKFKLQSYTIELEGTNSSGNIGGGGNLVYSHRSLFGGAEQFQSKFTGAFEILDQEKFNRIDNTVRLGTEVGIDFPKFLLPFIRSEEFVKKYHPKTSLSATYNYQERPDYTRTLANLSFGYRWRNQKNMTHYVNPLELNFLQLPFLSENFRNNLGDIYLKSSYDDHFLSVSSYSMIYNNQNVKKTNDFQYLRMNAEVGGNLLTTMNKIAGSDKVGDHYELFGIRYAQFFKTDIEFRHYELLSDNNRFVYRLFVGGGVPYGNSTALPFVKQYFSGGANSIRAWNVRALGPGSYTPKEDFRGYPNLTADFKFEANWEYRFDMFWILEGALFWDVGNIWSLNKGDERKGALLTTDDFLDELAIGSGLGLRFDLSFSVLRLDLGIKMKDPSYEKGERWLPGNRQINNETISWNIAIGYPF